VAKELPKLEEKIHKNWRNHYGFFETIEDCLDIFHKEQIHKRFLPFFFSTLKNGANETKKKICSILVQLLQNFSFFYLRNEIHETMIRDFKNSIIYKDRLIFLEFLTFVLQSMSKNYFKDHFLNCFFDLCEDKISNILLKICKITPQIRMAFTSDDQINPPKLQKIIQNIQAWAEKGDVKLVKSKFWLTFPGSLRSLRKNNIPRASRLNKRFQREKESSKRARNKTRRETRARRNKKA
jgi:hypothetical protein